MFKIKVLRFEHGFEISIGGHCFVLIILLRWFNCAGDFKGPVHPTPKSLVIEYIEAKYKTISRIFRMRRSWHKIVSHRFDTYWLAHSWLISRVIYHIQILKIVVRSQDVYYCSVQTTLDVTFRIVYNTTEQYRRAASACRSSCAGCWRHGWLQNGSTLCD